MLDDDDLWKKDYLEKIKNHILLNNAKIVYTWFDYLTESGIDSGKRIKENLQFHL